MPLTPFKRIAIYADSRHATQVKTIQTLINYLASLNVDVILESSTADNLEIAHPTCIPAEKLRQQVDLLLVVGGDGNMLAGAHIALQQHLPILGINRGTLGFLADIHPDAMDQLGDIVQGHYRKESRFFLQATLLDDEDRVLHQGLALNDVVLMPGGTAHMLNFSIHINEQDMCQQRADGLIITTPTGSTAYALSAGGPILHPALQAIALVPMLPHKLSSRPIVIDKTAKIDIKLHSREATSPCISCDGLPSVAAPANGHLRIHCLEENLELIHPMAYDYFNTLRVKLGWEHATTTPAY